jgi:glycosyltransferase involved in cell wall biosynthesis
MRIGIDARYLSHGLVGGVHHYVAQLVPTLARLAPGDDFYLYADRRRPFELSDLPANVAIRFLPWDGPLSSLRNDMNLARWMAKDQLDIAHFPANYGFAPPHVQKVVTLHDAINLLPLREIIRGHMKKTRTILLMTYLHFATRASLSGVAMVLTVSQDAAARIMRLYPLSTEKIRVVPHGVDRGWTRVDDEARLAEVKARLGLTRPFVLADALKNPDAVLRAWSLVAAELRATYEIVFFSRLNEAAPVLKAALRNGQARLVTQPSRDDLNAMFSLAQALIFPSWIEGFGLPVLEAMACGTPVIASDRGSIPEVTGDAALLSDVNDPNALAEHICQVLTSPGTARQLRLRGQARASLFTWERAAQATLASYAAAVEAGVRRVPAESAA